MNEIMNLRVGLIITEDVGSGHKQDRETQTECSGRARKLSDTSVVCCLTGTTQSSLSFYLTFEQYLLSHFTHSSVTELSFSFNQLMTSVVQIGNFASQKTKSFHFIISQITCSMKRRRDSSSFFCFQLKSCLLIRFSFKKTE
jgi:hypothetical protein